ncbi:MAG TPA: S53 family peptidase [Chloroflexota bacterium]
MTVRRVPAFLAFLAVFALMSPGGAAAQTPPGPPPLPPLPSAARVCPPGGPPTVARCHALVPTDGVRPFAAASPYGMSPDQIKTAYGFSKDPAAGAGWTIAIVDAYHSPTAQTDLSTFSQQYGLPPCTTANGCFRQFDQRGNLGGAATVDEGWALEIALDVQWAHAIAPAARVLLVEADNNSFSNLLAAVDFAKANAQYVSLSWGAGEFATQTFYDSRFLQAGVSFFASSGDSGLPASYPSASPNVISVGGTHLPFDTTTLTLVVNPDGTLTETGWSGSGGGCSRFEKATTAQAAFSQYAQVKCRGKRATPDVSLDADPNSGVSVYNGTPYAGQIGWWKVGGTSASAPMWAARSAVAGAVVNATYVYGESIAYRDITAGNNGASALPGYDLVTGRGSWIGASP